MGNWQNGVTALNEDNMNALYDLRRGSNVIASNTDLNDLTTAGTYRCDSSTIATTLVNCPVTSGFKMVVDYTVGTNAFRQTIIRHNSNADTWARTKSVDDWGEWKLQTNSDNAHFLGLGKAIPSETDLNDLTSIGTYLCPNRDAALTYTNCPVQNGFKLVVEQISSSTKRQTLKSNDGQAKTYIRSYTNAWEQWKLIAGNIKTYSTEEQTIGTWTNRKPIYRKVFSSTSFGNIYNTGIANVANIVNFIGFVYRKDYPNLMHTIPSRVLKSGYEIDLESLEKFSSGLQVKLTWGTYYDNTKIDAVVFIIEYTKTTD